MATLSRDRKETDERSTSSLVCRVLTRLCALPVDHVIETMRPLPVEPVAGAPPLVCGVAIIRGTPIPVVDLAWILAERTSKPQRFVTVKAGHRNVALAVDAVVGLREVPPDAHHELPPLLRDVHADTIASIGTLDSALLVVLNSARLVPEQVWILIDGGGPL